ncbi:kinase-like domain-containing protein [Gongronella butleri]|nr:kinase-like domain-containing protein [Gongronella butleri]
MATQSIERHVRFSSVEPEVYTYNDGSSDTGWSAPSFSDDNEDALAVPPVPVLSPLPTTYDASSKRVHDEEEIPMQNKRLHSIPGHPDALDSHTPSPLPYQDTTLPPPAPIPQRDWPPRRATRLDMGHLNDSSDDDDLFDKSDPFDDDDDDEEDTPFFANRALQRPLLQEFLQHADDQDKLDVDALENFKKGNQRMRADIFGDDTDGEGDDDDPFLAPQAATRLEEHDQEDAEREPRRVLPFGATGASLNVPSSSRHADTSGMDEIDSFFSLPTYDYSSNIDFFTPKLSIDEQQQQFRHYGKPLHMTTWPHFLDIDYFDRHDSKDRAEVGSNSPQAAAIASTDSADTPYFDTKFTVLNLLGSGEFSHVWKVHCSDTNDVYAVKRLKAPFHGFSDRWRQLMEARNMLVVQNSPHCLHLFNAWEQGGYLFLQMEFGMMSLETVLANQDKPTYDKETWSTLLQIGLGVQAIHDADVAHLDLKPSNILINAEGVFKIGDFGTSIRCPFNADEFKGEGDRQYMAPDLIRDEYDKPADLFSLGLIVFKIATLIDPPDEGEAWELIRLGDFSSYKQPLHTVPWQFLKLIRGLLQPQPANRMTIQQYIDAIPGK